MKLVFILMMMAIIMISSQMVHSSNPDQIPDTDQTKPNSQGGTTEGQETKGQGTKRQETEIKRQFMTPGYMRRG